MRRSEKLNIRIFLFHFKTMEMQRGYKFMPGKMFSGIKSDFSRFQGYISNCDDSFHSGKEIENLRTSNFVCLLVSSVPLLAPNFKSICQP